MSIKSLVVCLVSSLFMLTLLAQQPVLSIPKPFFQDDPKGLKLPPGVPRMVDTNGNVTWIDEDYTTKQYQRAALKQVIQEANEVAKQLQLPEDLPITESNFVEAYVNPFGFGYVEQMIGNVTTRNYTYYISEGNRFSFLSDMHFGKEWNEYKDSYTWPISRIDTNQAYLLATQWLTAVSMDVEGLNRDCRLSVEPDPSYQSPSGKFVPDYFVYWKRPDIQMGAAATVQVFTPTKKLLQLRVEDPRYILRKQITFSNLDTLLPGPTPILATNYPTYLKTINLR